MKIKKLFFCLIFFFVSCTNNLYIGDSYVLKELIKETSTSFIFNKMTSRDLYYLLDKNGKNIDENKYVIDCIKESKDLFLSIGIFDIIHCFDFSTSPSRYDTEILKKKLEMVDYYLENSFELIKEKKKDNRVYIIEQFNPLINNRDLGFNNYITRLNEILVEKSNQYNFFYLSSKGVEKYLLDDFVLQEGYQNFYLDQIDV